VASAVLALAHGDTTAALPLLREAAEIETISRADYAVEGTDEATVMFTQLAEARHDTTQWLLGLTLQRLRHPPGWGNQSAFLTDALLRDVYSQMTATGRPVPDISPDRLVNDPVPRVPGTFPVSYETYLDRQWTALFDRHPRYLLPRYAEPHDTGGRRASSFSASATRTVVLEYTSNLNCGGCWHEDRELSAIAQRYGPDRVLPLSFRSPGADGPVTGLADDLERWYYEWYPEPGVAGGDTLHHGVPRQIYQTAAGDTLIGYRIDGQQRMHTLPPAHRTETYMTALAQATDRELTRPPEARVQVETQQHGHTLNVTSWVDSLRGVHHRVALRLLLVRDTVWLRSGHVRRLLFNTVLAMSHSDSLSMGLCVLMHPTETVPIHYAFDLARLQQGILAQRTTDGWGRFYATVYWGSRESARDYPRLIGERNSAIARFSDPRDWQIDWTHVYLVAIVQDLDTGDMLQALRVPLHLTAPAHVDAHS
jgi:hypothetical protein